MGRGGALFGALGVVTLPGPFHGLGRAGFTLALTRAGGFDRAR